MSEYQTRFDDVVAAYPFRRWQQSKLEQYTDEICDAFTAIFDRLIQRLVSASENAGEQAKLDLIHQAVDALNALNEHDESLIETGEREDLNELINRVALACGLDPKKYGDGEGPAGDWRTW